MFGSIVSAITVEMSLKLVSTIVSFLRPSRNVKLNNSMLLQFFAETYSQLWHCGKTPESIMTEIRTFPLIRWSGIVFSVYQKVGNHNPFQWRKPPISGLMEGDPAMEAGCLLQGSLDNLLHPVAYCSRALNDAETRYDIIYLEIYAAYYVIKTFHPFCWANCCTYTETTKLRVTGELRNPSTVN